MAAKSEGAREQKSDQSEKTAEQPRKIADSGGPGEGDSSATKADEERSRVRRIEKT